MEATPSAEKLPCADSSWEQREGTFPTPWNLLITIYHISIMSKSCWSQLALEKLYLLKFVIPSCHRLSLLTVWAQVRKWGFAPQSSILPWPHEDVGLCQGGRAGPACWNPWWAPCLCLRMWKKPGTGPRSASQNYITIIPLSVSEASWAPAQSGRKVGEGWWWVGLWLKSAASGVYEP